MNFTEMRAIAEKRFLHAASKFAEKHDYFDMYEAWCWARTELYNEIAACTTAQEVLTVTDDYIDSYVW